MFDVSNMLKGQILIIVVVNVFQLVVLGGFIGQDQVNGDYVVVMFGVIYCVVCWLWNGCFEYCNVDVGNCWGIISNFLCMLGEGKMLVLSIKVYIVKDKIGVVVVYVIVDVVFVWCLFDSCWLVFECFELCYECVDVGFIDSNVFGVFVYGVGDQVMMCVINNFVLNYCIGFEGFGYGIEVMVYYGVKYVKGWFVDDIYDGYIDVIGFDLCQDVGKCFDIGVQGFVQYVWECGVWVFSGGFLVGVLLVQNVWISVGYNIVGYCDCDFEDDCYICQGLYVMMWLKFDQMIFGGVLCVLFGKGW